MLFTIKVKTDVNFINSYSFHSYDKEDFKAFVFNDKNKYISSSYSIENNTKLYVHKLITYLPNTDICESESDEQHNYSFRSLLRHIYECLHCNCNSFKDILNKDITVEIDDLLYVDVTDTDFLYDDYDDLYIEPYEELNTLCKCYDALDDLQDVIDNGIEKLTSSYNALFSIDYCREKIDDLRIELEHQYYIIRCIKNGINSIIERYHYEI